MAGVDITSVAALMGHRKKQMTMRYAHLVPDHKQKAVERYARHGMREIDVRVRSRIALLAPFRVN